MYPGSGLQFVVRFCCHSTTPEFGTQSNKTCCPTRTTDGISQVKDIPINKVVAEPFSSARILFPNHTVAYPPQATQSFAPSDLRVPSWPLHTGLSLAWYPNYVYRVPSRPSYIYHVETGIDDNLQDTRRPRRQIEWLVTPYALIRGPTSKERLPEIGATVPVQPRKQLATSLASLQSQGLKIWRRQTRPELPSTSHDSKGARCRKEGGRVRKTDATIEKPARLVARRGME